ncbi:MAG: hypothetical protein ACOYLO_01980 [Ferruginibacter sp.]
MKVQTEVQTKKAPDIIFSTQKEAADFFSFRKQISQNKNTALKGKTFSADENGIYKIPYSTNFCASVNFDITYLGLKKIGSKTDRILPPIYDNFDSIPVVVLANGTWMGKTDAGEWMYPYLSLWTYRTPGTQDWSTFWDQTGSGLGSWQYQNSWTQSSNGFTSSFGYATWSLTGIISGTGGGGALGTTGSETHTYALFMQVDNNGNKTTRVEQIEEY